ncbi:excisionase family DNA-binding protein [Streptomyces sp. JH14]|uniref:excisionase family DNA-binding protein n=1 Tax=Streptomyces sp. JH14 TaxID=2793630 RepID=UPI0023F921C0|nr:excisionase family DNA-binding protein [Streptomyces sp. JH14]MDF6043434.1 excisionase family DNA-binding protein [Streptomyces sp. JH14]
MTTAAPAVTLVAADPTLLLLPVEEAARRLGIGRTTCFALIASGELESVKVGSLRRIPADALAVYVARLREVSTAPRAGGA